MAKRKTITFVILSTLIYIIPCLAYQCSTVEDPKTRRFDSIFDYQQNKFSYDPIQGDFKGNFVDLSNTTYSVLQPSTFSTNYSNNIIKLTLNNNILTMLNDDTFLGLHCLEFLELQGSKIIELSSQAFDGLYRLRSLNLKHNHISEIHEGTFQNLLKLDTLDLSENNIKIIDKSVFNNLISIKYFNLSGNFISDINMEDWSSLNKLETLDLSHNLLSTIDFNMNFSLVHLYNLHLQNNLFAELNAVALNKFVPKLNKISLDNNNWWCDKLQDIFQTLNHTRTTHLYTDITHMNLFGVDCTERSINSTTNSTNCIIPNFSAESVDSIKASITKLNSLIVCFIAIVVIVLVLDILLRIGVVGKVVRVCRRRDDFYDNTTVNIENIRLLSSNPAQL